MILNELNRGDSVAVFLSVKNEAASSISVGHAAGHRVSNAASFNGNIVILADSDVDPTGFAGIATKDIASGSHGLIQALGAVDSVLLSHEGSSITITVGDPLVPGKAAGGLTSAAPTWANSGFKYVLSRETTVAISAVAYVKGYIRCL